MHYSCYESQRKDKTTNCKFVNVFYECLCEKLFDSRLLCVEPNRRMTIEEFLEHGWILNDNIPDTVLFTPKIIADDVSIKFVSSVFCLHDKGDGLMW